MARKFKKGINGSSGVRAVSYNGPKIMRVDHSDQRNHFNEGYNSVMIKDAAFSRNHYYHSEKDLPEILNYQKMAGVVDGVFSTVLSLEN